MHIIFPLEETSSAIWPKFLSKLGDHVHDISGGLLYQYTILPMLIYHPTDFRDAVWTSLKLRHPPFIFFAVMDVEHNELNVRLKTEVFVII